MEVLGIILMIQGFGWGIAETLFDRPFGVLHLLDVPLSAGWAVGALGLVLTVWSGLRRAAARR